MYASRLLSLENHLSDLRMCWRLKLNHLFLRTPLNRTFHHESHHAILIFFFFIFFFYHWWLKKFKFDFLFSVAGIPLSASILTTGIVCTFYTSLVSNPNHMKMIYIRLSKPKTVLFNPLQLTISIHILHTVLYTFPKELTRRICLRIKSF